MTFRAVQKWRAATPNPSPGKQCHRRKSLQRNEPPRYRKRRPTPQRLAADPWLDFQMPRRGPDSTRRPMSNDASFILPHRNNLTRSDAST